MAAKGIVLEMFRMRETEHVESDFYIITNPFSEEAPCLVTKDEARRFIKENELHVALKDNTGRIWDTAAHQFQRKWAVSERFRKVEQETQEETDARVAARKEYKKELWDVLNKIWGDGEEDEEE